MAETPQALTLKENRDATEVYELVVRRVFFTIVSLVLLLGLANVFGQSPTGSSTDAPRAELDVSAPVDELLAEARQQQIATLDEVRWAVLESNGKVSFIKRA